MPCPHDRLPTRAPILGSSRAEARAILFSLRSANFASRLYIRGEGATGVEGSLVRTAHGPKMAHARLQIVAANKNAGKRNTARYSVEFRGFSWKIYAVTATRLPEALRSPRVRYSTID